MSVIKTIANISAAQFYEIAQHIGPCELVRGEIIPTAPGGFQHSRATSKINSRLERLRRGVGLGHVLTNEAGLVVESDRGADVAYISYKRMPKDTDWEGFLVQPPELVVEVLGLKQSWDDVEQKVREYHAHNVDPVWVADPQTLSVRVYPRKGASSLLHEDDVITAPKILPGFKCRVGEFFGV